MKLLLNGLGACQPLQCWLTAPPSLALQANQAVVPPSAVVACHLPHEILKFERDELLRCNISTNDEEKFSKGGTGKADI